MPKIVTPETLRADARAHATAARKAATDATAALKAGDLDAAADAAKTLEAAGCYIRRACKRLNA